MCIEHYYRFVVCGIVDVLRYLVCIRIRISTYPSKHEACIQGWFNVVPVSIVGSLRDREVACSASDRQGSNFESCVWRTVSSQSSHHPQEVLLAQFSLYVHKGGLKPDSFHFNVVPSSSAWATVFLIFCKINFDIKDHWPQGRYTSPVRPFSMRYAGPIKTYLGQHLVFAGYPNHTNHNRPE